MKKQNHYFYEKALENAVDDPEVLDHAVITHDKDEPFI